MEQASDDVNTSEFVRGIVAGQLPSGAKIPDDEVDLEKSGVIDSMGWVGILSALEEATGIRNFGNPWPDDRPQSIAALVQAAREGAGQPSVRDEAKPSAAAGSNLRVAVAGWGYVLGSLRVEAAAVERECGLAPGTIRERAGIESVSRAEGSEDEVVLGQRAAEQALRAADANPEEVDFVVATSATFLQLPSLSAVLHNRLLLRESCGALDVGGACVGLLNALATAKGLLAMSLRRRALVVAAEVHSRRLANPQVPGEFRGLFGDGACAFVLTRHAEGEGNDALRLGEFIWGCAGSYASSLQLALRSEGALDVQFRGEQLGTAAVGQLGRVLRDLEMLSGRKLEDVRFFALHEPNPRLVEILAAKAGIPLEKLPMACRTCGNLGSVSCGVGLCTALDRVPPRSSPDPPPAIFLAAVGPGLLWGGTYVS